MPPVTVVPSTLFNATTWVTPSNGLTNDGLYTTYALTAGEGSNRFAANMAANTSIAANASLTSVLAKIKAREALLTGDIIWASANLGLSEDDSIALEESVAVPILGANTYSFELLDAINNGGGTSAFLAAVRAGTLSFSVNFSNQAALLARTAELDFLYLELHYTGEIDSPTLATTRNTGRRGRQRFR